MIMTTKKDVDYEALADKIASDDYEPTGPSVSIIDLAEVRAFELLRREYDEAVTNTVSLSRRAGASWAEVATALRVTEAEARATYGTHDQAERLPADPEGPPHDQRTLMLDFMVRCRMDAEHRLADAIARAKADTIADDAFLGSVLRRTEDEGRLR